MATKKTTNFHPYNNAHDEGFLAAGNTENAAFACVAAFEDMESDPILKIANNLFYSPMYKLATDAFWNTIPDSNTCHFELRLLCARCFAAGREAARIEAQMKEWKSV